MKIVGRSCLKKRVPSLFYFFIIIFFFPPYSLVFREVVNCFLISFHPPKKRKRGGERPLREKTKQNMSFLELQLARGPHENVENPHYTLHTLDTLSLDWRHIYIYQNTRGGWRGDRIKQQDKKKKKPPSIHPAFFFLPPPPFYLRPTINTA